MNFHQIQKDVIETALSAGKFIKKEAANFNPDRIEQKTAFNNLVSYVDKEAEQRIVASLQKVFPEAGFITEEGTVAQGNEHEYCWVIDPLDGTTNFLHGLPVYAVSIALIKKSEPVLGVVYHIGSDECFHAVLGNGAFCNKTRIYVSRVGSLNESLLATGFPYNSDGRSNQHLEIIKNFLSETHGIRRLGSAAIDLAFVAAGRLEGFFEYNLNPWDVAAGVLLVQEAGGRVTDFAGTNQYLFGKQMCASNQKIHDEMLALIGRHWVFPK